MRLPLWMFLVLGGTVLVLAGARAMIWGGGAVGGSIVLAVGVGMLVAAEVIRQRRERAARRERERVADERRRGRVR